MSENPEPQPSASISFETGDLKVTVSASGPNATEDAEKLLDKVLDYVDGDEPPDED
jgi:hypothetical protein